MHLAVTGLLDDLPDMVVSGINHGANMGDDTIYSGTVAAATEGFLLGIPAIAMSLAKQASGNYATAARVAVDLVARFQAQPLRHPLLLNVNVPDLPYERLAGHRITRLGRRHKAERVVQSTNPARRHGLLDRRRRRRRGCGRGHRLPRRRQRLRLDHATADRPHAVCAARPGTHLARRAACSRRRGGGRRRASRPTSAGRGCR